MFYADACLKCKELTSFINEKGYCYNCQEILGLPVAFLLTSWTESSVDDNQLIANRLQEELENAFNIVPSDKFRSLKKDSFSQSTIDYAIKSDIDISSLVIGLIDQGGKISPGIIYYAQYAMSKGLPVFFLAEDPNNSINFALQKFCLSIEVMPQVLAAKILALKELSE